MKPSRFTEEQVVVSKEVIHGFGFNRLIGVFILMPPWGLSQL